MAIQVEPGQWLLVNGPAQADGATASLTLGDYCVHAGVRTPLVPLHSADGYLIGCVLGEAIDLANQGFLHTAAGADGPTPAVIIPDVLAQLDTTRVENWLYGLGGDWSAVIVTRDVRRLYQSPCRSLVYDLTARRAAAAPASLLPRTDYAARFDRALFLARDMEHLGWLPAGLTCHRGVRRLLPNHALDLTSWQPVRHWAGPEGESTDTGRTIAAMSATMSATLMAVARTKTLNFAFTAGHDSRAVLAAARPLMAAGDARAFTIGIGDGSPDTVIPAEICAAIGLPHAMVPERQATASERELWLIRAGHCVGDANLRMHPTVWRFGPHDAVITGAAGEVGRARQWTSSDHRQTRLTAHGVIARLEVAPLPEMVEAMHAWLEGLAGHNALRILDLAHLEHRVGGWASPMTFGNPFAPYHCGPLEHRAVIAGMLALPDDWRRSSRYVDALIAQGWPELARWPYNRFAGARHYAYLASRLLSVSRIRRKLRLQLVSRLVG